MLGDGLSRGAASAVLHPDSIELFRAVVDAVSEPRCVYRKPPPPWQRSAGTETATAGNRREEGKKRAVRKGNAARRGRKERRAEDNGQGRRGIRISAGGGGEGAVDHSTFYTSGYCIRIYYNPRIPEENDSERRAGSGRGGRSGRAAGDGGGVECFPSSFSVSLPGPVEDGREIDKRAMRKR